MSRILHANSISRLLELNPQTHYAHTKLSQEEWIHLLKLCPGAFWMHSGDPVHPHAELTSGKCSNGFINTLAAISYPKLADLFASQTALALNEVLHDSAKQKISWVVGSAYGSITFSQRVASALDARHGFLEKGEGDTQVWRRFPIEANETVLIAEELISTTKTAKAVKEGIERGSAHPINFVPFVANLVHRSSDYSVGGLSIVYAVHFDIEQWDPDNCPLCALGSKKLKPKYNWGELTGQG